MESKWHNFLVRQKFISFLKYVLYILFTYMYTKAFLLCLIKAWERTSKNGDGEIGKHKLDEIRARNMKQKKWNKLDKSKISPYSPFLKYTCIYWGIVDLQCFRCTARWFSYTYTHILFFCLFSIHYRLLQDIDYSSPCYTVNVCRLLHIYFFN